jgi:hypothetical protein
MIIVENVRLRYHQSLSIGVPVIHGQPRGLIEYLFHLTSLDHNLMPQQPQLRPALSTQVSAVSPSRSHF